MTEKLAKANKLLKEQHDIPPIPEGYIAIFSPTSLVNIETKPDVEIHHSFWSNEPFNKIDYLNKHVITIENHDAITYLTNDFKPSFDLSDVLVLIKKKIEEI